MPKIESHPWITFSLSMEKASPNLWMRLGEAQSKCEHISGVPLRPAIAEYFHNVYLAKGVQATTAIEGNTLSEEEVRKRLDGIKDLPESREYLGQEVDNIIAACNEIGQAIASDEDYRLEMSLDLICSYNRLVLHNLEVDEDVSPGEIRMHNVGVGRYLAPDAKHCVPLMESLCVWLNSSDFVSSQDRIVFGLIKAVVAHIYIAWIHPFGDGNGRTARLLEFQILLESGVPSPAAHLLSNHYNHTRTKYYQKLNEISKNGGDILPFVEYAIEGFVDGLKEQLEIIRGQQLDVAWLNYIHQSFSDQKTEVQRRRRQLAYDLNKKGESTLLEDIPMLSKKLNQLYSGKAERTLLRDLEHLIDMKLVVKEKKGYRSRFETILAFLPFRKEEEA